jgi:hypothetical protein
MTTTTLSGPRRTSQQAREALAAAGLTVLDAPAMPWVPLDVGEVLLSLDGAHGDFPDVVTRLGWRHRGTLTTDVGQAVRVPHWGAQG